MFFVSSTPNFEIPDGRGDSIWEATNDPVNADKVYQIAGRVADIPVNGSLYQVYTIVFSVENYITITWYYGDSSTRDTDLSTIIAG